MTQRWPARRLAASAPGWPLMLTLVVTVGAAAAVVAAAYSFVLMPLTGAFSGPFEDFAAYAGAARLVAHGASPYGGFEPGTIVMSGFIYPPFPTVLLRPLVALSAHWQMVAWLWIELATLVGGALITARVLLPAGWPRARLAVLVALTFPPATYNLWHGQMNTVIFLLLAIALSDYVGGHRTRCGAVLGLAAAIKLAPIVLLVVLARRGWWRGVAAGIGVIAGSVAAGVLALGWPVTREYVDTVFPVLNRDNGWIYNQTWNGLVNRLIGHSVLAPGAGSAVPHLVATALSAATVALLLVAVRGGARSRAQRGAEFGCGVVAMLLAGSIAWYPVYVHLLIALAAAVGLAHERGSQDRWLAGWSVAALAGVGGVAAAAIATLTMQGILTTSHGPLWWLFLQACSLPAVLAAGLLVVMTRSLRSSEGTANPAVGRDPARAVAPA